MARRRALRKLRLGRASGLGPKLPETFWKVAVGMWRPAPALAGALSARLRVGPSKALSTVSRKMEDLAAQYGHMELLHYRGGANMKWSAADIKVRYPVLSGGRPGPDDARIRDGMPRICDEQRPLARKIWKEDLEDPQRPPKARTLHPRARNTPTGWYPA